MKRLDFEMKLSGQRLFFSFFLCVFFCLSAISGRGGEVSKVGSVKPPPDAPGSYPDGYELIGTVVDASAQFSPENLAILATAKSFKEFFQILGGMSLSRSAANVVVTAKGVSVTKKTVTDSQGKFKFTGLPGEQYEISAEKPSRFFGTGEKRIATARIPFRFKSRRWVHMELRADLVTVKGRITDSGGRPIAGAKVRGDPAADLTSECAMEFPTRFAVSGNDGFYELRDLVPPDIEDIGSYLMGLDPLNNIRNPFCVAVYVEADGFIQDTEKAPTVPLVTEELLGPARRLLNIEKKLQILVKGSSDMVEKKDIYLPSSHGNTITGIDIVLKKAGEGGR